MKYGKIGGLWVSGGAECLRSNRTEWNRKIGEEQRKNSDIITVKSFTCLHLVNNPSAAASALRHLSSPLSSPPTLLLLVLPPVFIQFHSVYSHNCKATFWSSIGNSMAASYYYQYCIISSVDVWYTFIYCKVCMAENDQNDPLSWLVEPLFQNGYQYQVRNPGSFLVIPIPQNGNTNSLNWSK